MALNTQIQKLQEEIFEELGQPSSISPAFIGDYIITNAGAINNLIGTSFSGIYQSGITPELQEDEIHICKLNFYNYWYKREINANLGANGFKPVEIREGDSVIRIVQKTEIAKNFQALQKENRSELHDVVHAYRIKRAIPATVEDAETI